MIRTLLRSIPRKRLPASSSCENELLIGTSAFDLHNAIVHSDGILTELHVITKDILTLIRITLKKL